MFHFTNEYYLRFDDSFFWDREKKKNLGNLPENCDLHKIDWPPHVGRVHQKSSHKSSPSITQYLQNTHPNKNMSCFFPKIWSPKFPKLLGKNPNFHAVEKT